MNARPLVLSLSLVVICCTHSDNPPEESINSDILAAKTEVRQLLDSYYEAFSARDWHLFENHFWPGATMTTIWAPIGELNDRVVVSTIPEFVEQAPLGPGSREIFEERLDSVEIRVEGDLALCWARYHARFGDPGDIMEWEGTDAFTLLRFDGEWKISSLAFLSDSE